MTDGDGGIPGMVPRAHQILGLLLMGKWVVWAHTWADKDGITPDEWRARVGAAIEECGINYEMVVHADIGITLIWNKLLPPTVAQKTNSILMVQQKLDFERRQRR